MYSLDDARIAIGSRNVFNRGKQYFEQDRVRDIRKSEMLDGVTYRAKVRGTYEYNAQFSLYDNDEIDDLKCDCPAFGNYSNGCKHLAALLIAVYELDGDVTDDRETPWERKAREARERQQARRQAEIDRARREYEAWVAEQQRIREEAERRERELFAERERREQEAFVNMMLTESGNVRRLHANPEQSVHLYPTLCPGNREVLLELRLGRGKTYVARNLWDFGARVRRSERFVYGKELTYSHTDAETAPEDVPLLHKIALFSQVIERDTGNRMPIYGDLLDELLPLLVGRQVATKKENGETVLADVVEGCGRLGLLIRQEGKRFRMLMDADNVIVGVRSAVFFLPEVGKLLCAFGEDFRALLPLLRMNSAYPDGMVVSEAQFSDICAQVLSPIRDRLELREGAKHFIRRVPTPMRPRFYIDAEEERLTCLVRFDYGSAELVPGKDFQGIRRDGFLENEALAAAESLFPVRVSEGAYAFEGSDEAQFALLTERLFALNALGEVMISDRLKNANIQSRRNVVFGLSPEGSELLLHSDLGGFTQEELRAALAAYRQKRKFVKLGTGMFLSGEALDQAAEVALTLESLGMSADELAKGARTPLSRAMYLEAALSERQELELSAPQELLDWTRRFRKAQKAKAQPPETLCATLRGYQLEGLTWLAALSDAGFGGILADDMGLGKTIQALSLLLREKERGNAVRALVVCPASLQLNWRSEAERFAPSLTVSVLMGGAAQRERMLHEEPAPELMITSYDQMRRDAALYRGIEFTHVFLDEAQNIKNAASQGAKAVKSLAAAHRFAMTGTPIENRLAELWSIFDFLMPGYLHAYKKFRDRFESPIVKEQDAEARRDLHLMTAPFILRRMKKDVLTDLPDKVETLMTSELTAEQRKLYAAYAAKLLNESEGGLADGANRMKILAGLTRLRQLCCDPALCLEEYSGGSGKLEQCLELVGDCLEAGHRILLFSQFTSMLAILEKRLNAMGVSTFRLQGDTDKEERMELVERFNGGEAQVFLISLKAGGTGLNLTGADVVIHYDPWWNTAAENQATDRAYRIGQTRGVQVYKLIAANTLEERIVDLQKGKEALAGDVLGGGESLVTSDPAVLRQLLRG